MTGFNFNKEPYLLFKGDCLEVLATMPDDSVDCVLADPPYFEKIDAEWDNDFQDEDDFLNWLEKFIIHSKRILKPTGSFYCFASPEMAAKVEILTGKHFRVLNHIVWRKTIKSYMAKKDPFLRKCVTVSERLIFAEHYEQSMSEIMQKSVFPSRRYMRQEIEDVRGKIDFREINTVLGTATTGGGVASATLSLNKDHPTFITRENYGKLQQWLEPRMSKPYDALRSEYRAIRESIRRYFNLTNEMQNTDVWEFLVESDRFHECQKPRELISHILTLSTKKDFIVCDPFMGSGATGVACMTDKRKFVGVEKDPDNFKVATARIRRANLEPVEQFKKIKPPKVREGQASLFD